MSTQGVQRTVQIPNIDIWECIFERATKPFPDDQVIYRDARTNRYYTYSEVKRTAQQFGAALISRWAWKKGDVLTTYSPNCIDTPSISFGCLWAAGTLSTANPAYTAEELARQLMVSNSKALATQLEQLPVALKAAGIASLSIDKIVLIGDEKDPSGAIKHFNDLLDANNPLDSNSQRKRVAIDPQDDLAFLVSSSGTTGHPKGVMLSHSNIVSDFLLIGSREEVMLSSGTDRILSFLPYYHIFGLQCLIHLPIYAGIETVVMTHFDLETFCSIVQNMKITYSYVAPPVVLNLAKSPVVDKYDLSSLRMITSGAAPLSKDLITALYDRLKVPTKQGYGLSESSCSTHIQAWDEWRSAMGSVGRPLPNLTVLFVDVTTGKPVPANHPGEIWIKGPMVFKGYLGNAEATENCMTNGFFKTGDIGYQDELGNMYVTDRIKELIKYKGFQVAPAELEGILASHPSVSDVAVCGRYVDAIASEVPVAFLVPAKGVTSGLKLAEELIMWFNGQVAAHKQLRGGVVWMESIPKSPTGKLLRRVLHTVTDQGMGAVKYDDTAVSSRL